MRRLTPVQLQNTLRDLFRGAVDVSDLGAAPVAPGLGVTGYSTEPAIHPTSPQAVEHFLTVAETVALRVAEARATIWPCSAAPDAGCRDTILDDLLLRGQRRPPTSAERDRARAVFDAASAEPGADFADGVATVVVTLLQSPEFLYQVEIGEGNGEPRQLTPYEVASRLSYLFWDSMPDEALFEAARRGELGPDRRVQEARRLLADPRADATLSRFFREWIRLERLDPSRKDSTVYPEFDLELAKSMDEELDRFVRHLVREGGTLRDLFTSRQTWVDGRLASFYGTSPVTEWSQVELDPSRRAGILTKPALLAHLAHEADTSYVHRGVFVLTRVLCENLPAPPMDALTREPSFPANATNRDESEIRRESPECGACHRTIDPIGLTFENYDAIGRYRTTWPEGVPVNASGALPSHLDVGGDVEDAVALSNALGDAESVRECMTRQWYRFAFARRETSVDECNVQRLLVDWTEDGERLDALLLAPVHATMFAERTMEAE
ncbi:MAG: DUF1592 domain-containing protein [Sandaracinus sp.]|nr:DUF1592 domain-containing protein [Sandaracinus sp.]MCB9616847.1 DUF1592 domain-containing protein [Sandaracinus sp.]MCB9625598.1 DUF1592 domain-containing protein [Sandaracinus sp.]MCB9634263.1 DUF1592 domain-containing protein [Sandaracinus sp.]